MTRKRRGAGIYGKIDHCTNLAFAPGAMLAALAALTLFAGCSGGESGVPGGNAAAETIGAETTLGDTTIGGDTAVTDTGNTKTDGDGADVGVADATDGAADGGNGVTPCSEIGGWGCECKGNNDCNSQWCVDTDFGKQCTVTCFENCPSNDWACVQAGSGGGDLTYVCVPKFTSICQPCAADADCEHLGAAAGVAKCRAAAKDGVIAGSFCTAVCKDDGECPADYTCADDGGGKICLPKSGECQCSVVSKASGATTSCSITNSDGTCSGSRSCGADGLSPCSAKTAKAEACNAADDDCDGQSDEGFVYDDIGSPKTLGSLCGVGACLGGQVECSKDGSGAICSSSAKGIAETCDYVDNDCDGKTDEDLTSADSSCKLVGVCSDGGIVTKCDIGKWACDYAAIVGYEGDAEKTCDSLDNDCDGKTDENFEYSSTAGALALGSVCDGVGACGAGIVECGATKNSAVCSTDPGASADGSVSEICDGIDNDCDGLVDEGCDDDKDGYCDVDMPYGATNTTCVKGKGDCNDEIADISPGATEVCDNLDNDCDGDSDEGCDDDKDGYCDEMMVIVGQPKICTAGVGDCADGDAAVSPGAKEVCNGIDDDCDTSVDAADVDLAKAVPACANQKGVCSGAKAPVELCKGGTWEACSDATYGAYSKDFANDVVEAVCDDLDNNCDGVTDDECDKDQDGYCDKLKQFVGNPAICKYGGGDCNDGNGAVSPGAQEDCNDVDDDCDLKLDAADPDLDKVRPKCENQKGVCLGSKKPVELCKSGAWEVCNEAVYGNFDKGFKPGANETLCDDLDNNCDGGTDIECDSDKDGYCDASLAIIGKPAICPKGGNDCDDEKAAISPAAKEVCGGSVDDNCNGAIDEEDAVGCEIYYPDLDDDKYGDKFGKQRCLCVPDAKNKYTTKDATDCNDKQQTINPGVKENCSTVDDDNCNGVTNEVNGDACTLYYYDLDSDNYGDKTKSPVCMCAADPSKKLTALKGGDCNDDSQAISPSNVENCLTTDDDNCNGSNNDIGGLGCEKFYPDKDKDGFGASDANGACLCAPDAANFLTSTKATDCDDGNDKVKPGIKDTCATAGVDDNCDGTTDGEDSNACTTYYYDGDHDGAGSGASRCLCKPDADKKYDAKVSGDCNDNNAAIKPGAPEICNGVDDDCAGGIDDNAVKACKSASNAIVACTNGKCVLAGCTSTKYYDIDKDYGNGCECAADADFGVKGASCAAFRNLGTLTDKKGAASFTGNITPGESGQWFSFYAMDLSDSGASACDKFHVYVDFTSNPSSIYQFDIYRTSCASTNSRICQNETVHEWRTNFYSNTSAYGPGAGTGVKRGVNAPSPATYPSGECKCSTTAIGGGQSMPGMGYCIDNSAYYFVYVHHKAGVPDTCSNFTLRVRNGLF